MDKPLFDSEVGWYKCPSCDSIDIHYFRSGIRISDKDGYVEFNADGVYEAFQCQVCGWNNI